MSDVEKTTVYLDSDAYTRIKMMARKQNRPAAELVREAVKEYAMRHSTATLPSSFGAGHSGRADLSESSEELLSGFGESE